MIWLVVGFLVVVAVGLGRKPVFDATVRRRFVALDNARLARVLRSRRQ